MVIVRILFPFLLSTLFLSCSTYSDRDFEQFDQRIQQHLEASNTHMERMENGMYFHIISSGEGENIRLTDRVTFSYTGSFLDGEVFQVIRDHEALNYEVRELIIGWQEALVLIAEGGEIEIIIPPHLGYGNKDTGMIPANSTLHYRLKVLAVE
jgi:FKBP-type peptidyl-prolyl cis-trans isomerase FkpA